MRPRNGSIKRSRHYTTKCYPVNTIHDAVTVKEQDGSLVVLFHARIFFSPAALTKGLFFVGFIPLPFALSLDFFKPTRQSAEPRPSQCTSFSCRLFRAAHAFLVLLDPRYQSRHCSPSALPVSSSTFTCGASGKPHAHRDGV